MIIIVSALAVLSLTKIFVETPAVDNSGTQYCTADVKYKRNELQLGQVRSCTQGTMKVEKKKLDLAERKAP